MSDEQQMTELESIGDGLDVMAAEYIKLQAENEELKKRLERYELPYSLEVPS